MKILPFTSQAMHVGGIDGRAKTIGPTISVGASAVTQLSSSFKPSASTARTSDFSGFGGKHSSSVVGALRFFDFLSPLNDNGFTILSPQSRIDSLPGQACRWVRRYLFDDLMLVIRESSKRVTSEGES